MTLKYAEFKDYQISLPEGVLRLDDLNPYPINGLLKLPNLDEEQYPFSNNQFPYFYKGGLGVRNLLRELFRFFGENNLTICLPTDVYPAYFKLLEENQLAIAYETLHVSRFELPVHLNCALLIANPLIPEGRYLKQEDIEQLKRWLQESDKRWLIVDTVYDYHFRAIDLKLSECNVVYVGSDSKIALSPGRRGWAVSSQQFLDATKNSCLSVSASSARLVQAHFDDAWVTIHENLRNILSVLQPEVGYLTTVACDYRDLLNLHGIAAIPASVFGSAQANLSVISCISEVKNALQKI